MPYLAFRSGTYFLRVAVPKSLQSLLGQAEIFQNLKTNQREEARILALSLSAELFLKFAEWKRDLKNKSTIDGIERIGRFTKTPDGEIHFLDSGVGAPQPAPEINAGKFELGELSNGQAPRQTGNRAIAIFLTNSTGNPPKRCTYTSLERITTVERRYNHLDTGFMAKTPSQKAARKIVATNILYARTMAGWSQEELAEKAGLHRTQIGEIERQTSGVSVDTLSMLATAIGVPMSVLLLTPTEAHPIIMAAIEKK